MSALSVPEKSKLERCEAAIETGLTGAYSALVTIRDEQLYRETYSTFEVYCRERWGISRSRAYQLIEAAKTIESLKVSTIVDTQDDPGPVLLPTREAQVRPLAQLPEPERPAAWKEAVEESGGKPTAKAVQKVVNRKLGKPEKPAPEPAPEPAPAPISKVNGVAQADPPDVAALRAAGKIPAGVVVEVIEPESGDTLEDVQNDHAEAAGKADDLTDAEWLETLPARAKLGERPRRIFDADALVYRRLEPHRKTFQHHAVRIAKGRGSYAWRVLSFVKTDHPKHWLPCPAVEHGGCDGSGEVPLIGECPKCHGRGYRINK